MPGPYINQAPVDDGDELRDEDDRPQGADPQTMAILSRILQLLEKQSEVPEPMIPQPAPGLEALLAAGGGGPPGMPPGGPGMPPPGMGGPPGLGGPPPGMPPPPT